MKTDQLSDQELAWLERFFADPNKLTWQNITEGTGPADWLSLVRPWLSLLERNDPAIPIVLPIFDFSGVSHWYAMACDARRSAQLAQELNSFVGPSYTNFDGKEASPLLGDSIDKAVHGRFEGHIYRFSALGVDESLSAQRALSTYCALLSRRPPIPNRILRPIGQIRSDFDRALALGDVDHADRLIEEFSQSGRISAEQRQFLLIRRHAGLGEWGAIGNDSSLIRSVAELSLPPQTLLDVVEALYRCHIESIEATAAAHDVVATFKQRIGDPYPDLFREQRGIRGPRFLRAFILSECSQKHPDSERYQHFLRQYPSQDQGLELVERWIASIRTTSQGVEVTIDALLDKTHQAWLDENYEKAIEILGLALPDSRALEWLIRYATKSAEPVLGQLALKYINLADVTDAFNLEAIGNLRALAENVHADLPPEASWLAWVSWVCASSPTHDDALNTLNEALPRWTVEDYRQSPSDVDAISRAIGNADDKELSVLRVAYPKMYLFFADGEGLPDRIFMPIYAVLLKLIACQDGLSSEDLELANSLAAAMFEAGVSKKEYEELILDLEDLVDTNSSFNHLGWILDTAELISLNSAPDQESKTRFLSKAVSEALKHTHRLTYPIRVGLRMLAKDFGCEDLLSELANETPESQPINDFDGVIGIYSLMDSAAQRAKQILEQTYPSATVELNNDHVATDRLRALVQRAAVMVFAWKSSKHQAYYAAKEARKPRDLCMARGKGTTSIVDAAVNGIA